MPLHSRICDMLGIRTPILLAGMGRAATPELAAAVSNAGGLGVLGAAACGPNQLREWIRRTRELTDKPFGVDTLLPASVRRGGKQNAGVSPMDVLPHHQRFAQGFMQREGLPELDAEALASVAGVHPADRDGPRVLSKEFFEAQMEVVIGQRVALYAARAGQSRTVDGSAEGERHRGAVGGRCDAARAAGARVGRRYHRGAGPRRRRARMHRSGRWR